MKKAAFTLIIIIAGIWVYGYLADKLSNYELVGFYERDTGISYYRVLSFYVKDYHPGYSEEDFRAIEKHAKKQLSSKNGSTFVFYFNDRNNTPELTHVGIEIFSPEYEAYCIAGYWKYPTGQERFAEYPFFNQ